MPAWSEAANNVFLLSHRQELWAELGIEAVQEGTWSWHQNPALTQALEA
ncbi:hypothetical protein [Synechococcus sp. CCY 0621]|nr:hypothetical protein [Synechococcus sp. CCY 0621]